MDERVSSPHDDLTNAVRPLAFELSYLRTYRIRYFEKADRMRGPDLLRAAPASYLAEIEELGTGSRMLEGVSSGVRAPTRPTM